MKLFPIYWDWLDYDKENIVSEANFFRKYTDMIAEAEGTKEKDDCDEKDDDCDESESDKKGKKKEFWKEFK